MKERFKKFFQSLVAKALVASLGVKGVLAKFFWEKFAVTAAKVLVWAIESAHNTIKKHEDEKKAGKHDETLKDGATEDAQKGAATDLLNN